MKRSRSSRLYDSSIEYSGTTVRRFWNIEYRRYMDTGIDWLGCVYIRPQSSQTPGQNIDHRTTMPSVYILHLYGLLK